jgi:AraC-like DNA-binding protein
MTIVHDQRILQPSPIARRLLWHLLAMGRTTRDEGESYAGRDKAGMLLCWIAAGRGTLVANRTRYKLNTGPRCWLIDVAYPRSFIPESRRMTNVAFRFDGPGLKVWTKSLGGPGEFQFSSRVGVLRLEQAREHMLDLVTRRPVNYEWHLHETLTRVLGQLLSVRKVLIQPETNVAPPRPVARVLQAVLSDPARAWRAPELASLAEISYSGLRSLFRESQHESLSEFLRRIRLDQAKLMLLDERLAVKEISSRLGFSSEFYFSQWFRRETGTSPSRFRDSVTD